METDGPAACGDYQEDARLLLLTAAEAREAIRLLETLDLTPQLAAG
ncbi:hypothetical protein ACFT0G_32520 [Streptomyces sp. NPDC057020]